MSCRCLACYIIITIDQSFFCCLRSRTSRTFCACTFWRLLSLSVEKPVFWETLSRSCPHDTFKPAPQTAGCCPQTQLAICRALNLEVGIRTWRTWHYLETCSVYSLYTQYSCRADAQEEPTVPLAQLSPAAAEAVKSLAQNKGFTVYKVTRYDQYHIEWIRMTHFHVSDDLSPVWFLHELDCL